jgi:hypothetical protein
MTGLEVSHAVNREQTIPGQKKKGVHFFVL